MNEKPRKKRNNNVIVKNVRKKNTPQKKNPQNVLIAKNKIKKTIVSNLVKMISNHIPMNPNHVRKMEVVLLFQ